MIIEIKGGSGLPEEEKEKIKKYLVGHSFHVGGYIFFSGETNGALVFRSKTQEPKMPKTICIWVNRTLFLLGINRQAEISDISGITKRYAG